MRTNLIRTGAAALFMSLINVNQAFAWCLFGGIGTTCDSGGGSGGATAVPEFDGPGAIAAAALLVSLVAIIYYRVRK